MKRFLWPLLFVSATVFTLPRLVETARSAIALAPLKMEERRARLFGEDYEFIRSLARTLPPDESIAILAGYGGQVDRAIFANYYLYPRPTRIYIQQITTLAARSTIVVPKEGPMRRTFVADPRPYGTAKSEFLVPFVAAVDALDPYTSEAVIESDRNTQITLTLMPAGTAKTYSIRAGRPLVIGDVLFHEFGTKGVGWLRVTADAPVRGGVWFVNRGGAQSAAMPLVTRVPTLPQTIPGGEKLWVLNAGDTDAKLRINGNDEGIAPRAIVSWPAQAVNTIEGDASVLAFTTRKMPDGNTRFTWPEGLQ